LDLSKEDSGDGLAVFIIFILGATVVPLALWAEARLEPPLWLHAIVWSVVSWAVRWRYCAPSRR